MRDAQSLLDQVVAYCGMEVRDEDVDQILGHVGVEALAQCLRALFQQDAAAALHLASLLQSEGHETAGIARALLEGLRHLIVLKTVPHPDDLIPLSEADLATLRTVAELASLEEIYGQFHVLSAAEQTLRHASNPFLGLEMTLVRMACIGRVQPLQSILEHRPNPLATQPPDAIFQTPAWLITEANFPPSKLMQMEKYITTRSQSYRVQVVGYFDRDGPSARVEAVIDTNGGRPRIVYRRDLMELMLGFNLEK